MIPAPTYTQPSELEPIDAGWGTAWAIYWGETLHKTPVSIIRVGGKEVWATTRQLQCLALTLVAGRKEAAFALGIKEHTVRHHLTNLFRSLGCERSWEAALILGWSRLPKQLERLVEPYMPVVVDERRPRSSRSVRPSWRSSSGKVRRLVWSR